MRNLSKITFVCCLAGSLSLSAYANVGDKITSLDQLSNGKCYTITPRDNTRGTWYYNSQNPAYLYSTGKTNVGIDTENPNQQFAFLKSSSGKYYVYNVGGKKFLSYSSNGTVALLDQLVSENSYTTFTPSTGSADYPWVVTLNGHHVGISNGYAYGVITSYQSTNDGGNCVSITEAADFDSKEVMQQVEDFEKAYTEENATLVATANNILKVPQRAVGGYDPALWGTLNELCGGDAQADIYDAIKPGFQEALTAVQNSTSAGLTFNNDKVYKIQNFTASNGYLYSKQEEGASRIFSSAKQNDLATVEKSEYWQVCTANGYTVLYNQGTKTYAQYDNSKGYWVLSADPTFMNIQSNQNKGTAAFSIQDSRYTGNQQYMHVNNSYETGVVGWSTDADATNFYFVEQPDVQGDQVDVATIVLQMKQDEARAIISGYDATKSNYVGSYSQEIINALKALLEDPTTTFETLEAGIKAVQNSTKQPESGKFYTIQSTMTFNDAMTKAIYENPDGTNIAWNTVSQAPAELWQFEPDGSGHYYIKSANTGKYLQLNPGAGSGTLVTEQGSAFTLEQKDNSITLALINYTNNDKATLVLQTSNGWGSTAKPENESGNYVGTYNGFGASLPTTWNVIEATDVKVGISDAKYATAWLPCAINLSGTNVEAYTVSKVDNGVATLEKVEGAVPAQTAVILHGESGTYTFNIESDNNQDAISSELQGTAIATTIDAGINAYILGQGEQGVGFYQMNDTDRTLGANKAYLALPATVNVRSIIFSDGQTTGIESTVAESTEAEEYYDLQGRRVMNPTKGIYVTKSGKKVVINK